MKNIVIVEDDPMVALINKKYVEMIEGFKVHSTVKDKKQLIEVLDNNNIDLILMDVYLPNENGIQILKSIRESEYLTDVIMMTAADSANDIKTAFAYGVIDYLIKPFEFERFKEAIDKYNKKNEILHSSAKLEQSDLDKLYNKKENLTYKDEKILPKGISYKTLDKIYSVVRKENKEYWTIRGIADKTGISNVTIKKYVDYLEKIGEVKVTVDYGNIGRPEYKCKFTQYIQN